MKRVLCAAAAALLCGGLLPVASLGARAATSANGTRDRVLDRTR